MSSMGSYRNYRERLRKAGSAPVIPFLYVRPSIHAFTRQVDRALMAALPALFAAVDRHI